MKINLVSLAIAVFPMLGSWVIHTGPSDSEKIYREVVIGKQTWMVENLRVITFRNGDTIQEARTIQEWRSACMQKKPAWCYNHNDSSNGTKYGILYNSYAVIDPRGLAPVGWKIPTADDWFDLRDHTGDKKNAGVGLKSTSGWLKNGNGTNSTGFSALPGGSRELELITRHGGFRGIGLRCFWWTTTKIGGGGLLAFSLDWRNNKLIPNWDTYRTDGYYVRCIRQ